jgi:NAD(P)-dependent dehydrogenase (short-subunit alcohol dehydrogenase family)
MIKSVLPYMKTQGQGIIHNVSSGVGITGFSGISGYSSTKGAIESFTRTLSFELAPYGISVNLRYRTYFAENFKQSIIVGVLYTTIGLFLFVDIQIVNQIQSSL